MQCVSIIIYLFHFMSDRGGAWEGDQVTLARFNEKSPIQLQNMKKKAGIKVFVRL